MNVFDPWELCRVEKESAKRPVHELKIIFHIFSLRDNSDFLVLEELSADLV